MQISTGSQPELRQLTGEERARARERERARVHRAVENDACGYRDEEVEGGDGMGYQY